MISFRDRTAEVSPRDRSVPSKGGAEFTLQYKELRGNIIALCIFLKRRRGEEGAELCFLGPTDKTHVLYKAAAGEAQTEY